MKITTGGKELLETVTFLALGLGETVLTLSDPDPDPLRFILDFVEDDSKKATITTQVVDNKTLKLILGNWKSSLGATLTEPIAIGNYRERKLSILFHIAKAGEKGEIRLVTFSLYLGEKV